MDNLTDSIKQCIINVEEKFINDPFKYFAEKDLHFELQEQFKNKYPNGPYYIHREYPVVVKNFEFGKGKMKQSKSAYIDIVVTSLENAISEKPLLGIEMFLGKFNDNGLINIGSRRYFLTQSNLTYEYALEHLQKDYWKLNRIIPNNYFFVYFLTHVFTRETVGHRRERIKRISQITDALRNYTEISQERLIIIETIYENGIQTNRQELGLPKLNITTSDNTMNAI